MQSKVPFEPLIIDDLARFHGHIGPFVALGARIGEHAVTVHGIPRYFGLTVQVRCPSQPPHTCTIDGLQQSTGATMGKRNIVLTHTDRGVVVVITDDASGKQLAYSIKPSLSAMLEHWEEEGELSIEERGTRLFEMKPEELFDIMIEKGTPTDPKR